MSDKDYKIEIIENNKLKGNDIIALLETLLEPAPKILSDLHHKMTNPFSVLTDNDLDDEDEVAQSFKKDHGGCGCCCKAGTDTIRVIVADLKNKSKKVMAKSYRDLFNLIQNALKSNSEAIVAERFASVYQPMSPGKAQSKAYDLSKKISQQLSDAMSYKKMSQIQELLLDGNDACLRTASNFTKELYSACVHPGTQKLAMISIYEQMNQPYQMCPKGISVWGKAIPMEIQKCRENCIDVKWDKDGKIGCAYADWLHLADNHGKTMAKLEVHKNVPEEVRMELKDGERAKDFYEYERSYEHRLNDERLNKPKTFNALEWELDKTYKRDDNKTRMQDLIVKAKENEHVDMDQVMESILSNDHDVFDEDELDFLEALLKDEREGED